MARGCTIPCTVGGVEARIRARALQDTLPPQTPFIGLGLVLAVASIGLIGVSSWQVAVVAAIFFMLGALVIAGRAVLATQDAVRLGVPDELVRIVDEHQAEIFPAQLPRFRAGAVALMYDTEDYRKSVTRFLEELRLATGEALRCPCRKRRLPLPFPLPF
jgi:hypothetical protein